MPEEITNPCWLCPLIGKIVKLFTGEEEAPKEPEEEETPT